MSAGRPPLNPESVRGRVNEICQLVAEGKTLRQIQADMLIPIGTMLGWLGLPEFSEQYARARDAASDVFETDILEAAQCVTSETASADRVKIDALKWIAARRSPKKYGDKLTNEHTGPNGGPVQTVTRIELVALGDDRTDSAST